MALRSSSLTSGIVVRQSAIADGVTVQCHPRLEQIGNVGLLPLAELGLCDVRDPTFALWIWTSGETLRGDDRAQRIARTMTLGAVAGAIDEIGAAIPLR